MLLLLNLVFLSACSGGGSGSNTNTSVTSFELLDPIAAINNKFGTKVVILPNGNIVISAPTDSSVAAPSSGAVHLYNPYTQTLIASFYGDSANDQLGSSSITALANNNFVIASRYDDDGATVDAGSVMLVNGTTGAQIGSTLVGNLTGDQLGSSSITALANNNFVIASQYDDETVVDGGTVRLVDTTGAQIGSTIAGDVASDQLGSSSITALANSNYVIASSIDDEGSIPDAGSIRQMDGATGNPIRTIVGSVTDDINLPQVIDSPKGDFYIISLPNKDNNTMVDSGFVTLIARPVIN